MTFWAKVMKGRNGIDTINMALLFIVLLFNFITKLVYAPVLAVVSLFALTLALYRTFSKRLEARRREDAWFSGILRKISDFFKKDK